MLTHGLVNAGPGQLGEGAAQALANEQLAFLHSHPAVRVLGTRAAEGGATLVADVEMDELTHSIVAGRWGNAFRQEQK